MADFNPTVQAPRDPNFVSNRSEQPRSAQYSAVADQSTSDIIMNNLTNVIPPLAEGGDRLTKLAVDNSIYDQNDKLNREFGATDMISLNDAKVPSVPSSLEDSAKNLQRVGAAYQSGAISKTTFDVKVASMASDLRAQYSSPYLRDYIDKKVQDVTGVDPQNQVRRDIFAQVQKNQESALEQEKKKTELATSLAKDGVYVPGWEKMPLDQFISSTAAAQKYKDQHNRFQASAQDQTTAQNLTDEDHIRATQDGVTSVIVQGFNNIHSNLGKTKAEIDQSLTRMSTMTGQEKTQLVTVTNQWADQQMALARKWVISHYTGGNLNEDRIKQILTPTKMLLDNYREAVVSGNKAALDDMTDRLNIMKTRDDVKFMDVDHVRAAGAANRVLGNLAGAAAMEQWLPQITKDSDRVFAKDELDQAYGTENGTSVSDSYRRLRDHGVKDQRAFDSLTGTPGAMLENPNATPDQIAKSARFLYGADNYQFIASLPDSQRAKAYATLYSPQRTAAMTKIRDSGDINTWNMYVTSAKRMFGPAFRQAAMSMQQNSVNPGSYRVSYDGNTSQFVFDQTLDRFNPRGNAIAVPSHPEIDQINQGLRAIAPVLKANGQSVDDYLQRQFEESGMVGPPGGWKQSDNPWNQLGGAFYSTKAAIDLQNGKSNLGGPGAEGAGAPKQPTGNEQVSGEDAASRRAQLKDLTDAFNKTDDPEVRSMIKAEMKSLTGPVSTFQPRGAPATGTPTDEQQGNARDVIDMLTGIPSFAEAVKKGDLAGAALAAATIVPFPAGRAAKAGEAVVEGGAKIISNASREAAGVERSIAQTAEKFKNELPKMTDEQITQAIKANDDVLQGKSKALNGRTYDQVLEENRLLGDEQVNRFGQSSTKEAMEDRVVAGIQKAKDFAEERSQRIFQQYTPTEIGKKIDQIKDFMKYSTDPQFAKFHEEELALWERARDIAKESIKSVK